MWAEKRKWKKVTTDRTLDGTLLLLLHGWSIAMPVAHVIVRNVRPRREREPWKIAPSLAREMLAWRSSSLKLRFIWFWSRERTPFYALLPVPSCITRNLTWKRERKFLSWFRAPLIRFELVRGGFVRNLISLFNIDE